MTEAQEPSIPQSSDDPATQRLLTGVRELVRTLIRTGEFLTRQALSSVERARNANEQIRPLKWGVLNRFNNTINMPLQLPRTDSKWIGVPLYVMRLDKSGIATNFEPSGFGADGKTRPLINGASSFSSAATGLFIFMTDGQDWSVNVTG